MKRAGLTHGGFYAHFENRDDLVAHAVDRMFQQSSAMLARHLDQEDVAAGLHSLIDFYLSDAMRLAVDSGCPLPGLSGDAARMSAQARHRFASGILFFRTVLQRALETIGAEDPATLAASILAEMVGAMALARAAETDDESSTILSASRKQLRARLGNST